MASGLATGFLLDRRWHWMTAGVERSKEPDLLLLARILGAAQVRYALIGGVALQVYRAEPRATLDIDLAVADREAIPRRSLETAGFTLSGRFEHSENWVGPQGTPVQFTDDPAFSAGLDEAEVVDLRGEPLRVLSRPHLLRAKLRASADPARRRSKRLQDLADAQALLEDDPTLGTGLTAAERALLDRLG